MQDCLSDPKDNGKYQLVKVKSLENNGEVARLLESLRGLNKAVGSICSMVSQGCGRGEGQTLGFQNPKVEILQSLPTQA